jgi:peptidoglycan hydrolase-like protein with peptidoglycan-binding domain
MFRKKLLMILSRVLFIVCTLAISFAFVGHAAHAAGPVTKAAVLYCPATIQYGSSDGWNATWGSVHAVQASLNSDENAGLKIDGYFGSLTEQAVYNWQRYHAFPNQPNEWDGIVGPLTWHSLGYC